jgi:hypothetical protein
MEQEIAKLVVDAVRDHGISHSNINKAIREALNEASADLPKTRVLVNNCHGGFGLSSIFKDWMNHNGFCAYDYDAYDNDSDRVRLAKYMVDFGAHIAQKHPSILAIISILASKVGKTLNATFYKLEEYRNKKSILDNINENIKNLDKALNHKTWSSHSTTKLTKYHMTTKWDSLMGFYDLQKFTKEDARQFRDTLDIDALKREYQVEKQIMDFPTDVIAEIEAFRFPKCEEKTPRNFIDCIEDKPTIAWQIQHFVNTTTSSFLAAFANDIESPVYAHFFKDVDYGTQKYNEKIGLLAASSKYSKLKIEDVSTLQMWWITEYDGLEDITSL